jgi:hypothetical protein
MGYNEIDPVMWVGSLRTYSAKQTSVAGSSVATRLPRRSVRAGALYSTRNGSCDHDEPERVRDTVFVTLVLLTLFLYRTAAVMKWPDVVDWYGASGRLRTRKAGSALMALGPPAETAFGRPLSVCCGDPREGAPG